jgi:hypothetical protein
VVALSICPSKKQGTPMPFHPVDLHVVGRYDESQPVVLSGHGLSRYEEA